MEIKYNLEISLNLKKRIVTLCPYNVLTKLGVVAKVGNVHCKRICHHFNSINKSKQTVTCNHPGGEKMEIKYETSIIDSSKCVTPCPYGFVDIAFENEPIKVGSLGCGHCTHFERHNHANQTITCSHPGGEK